MNNNTVVLYVEDDPASRDVMKIIIEEVLGISNLVIFESSHNFLHRVNALDKHPEVVLLDIHVPPHDGFEMLSMLRTIPHYQATPIVALTASVMNEEIFKLREAGFDGIISKPVDMDLFPGALQRLVDGHSVWTVAQ